MSVWLFCGSVFALALLATVIVIIVTVAMGILRWLFSGLRRGPAAEEARTLQAIHQQLSKMDARVEALETLVVERTRKDPNR